MSAAADPGAALALLATLPLEDGRLWGACAATWQWEDVRAFLDRSPRAVRRHLVVRGRGMSKTSDLAAVILALLLTEAPARSRSFVYAADADQAAIMLDRIAGYVERAKLGALIEVGASTVTNRSNGATVSIESSDGASAFGRLPWLQIVDEFSVWPTTDNYRRLWSAIVSAQTKVAASRLIVISMGGSPASLAAQEWAKAEQSAHWRTSRHPGPSPWASPEDVAAERESLTDSEYRRLILGEFAEGDDALVRPEDALACIRPGSPVLPPHPRNDYIATLDVGTRRDLTALAIGHAESRPAGRVVVVDRVVYWRPTKGVEGRVDLTEVEATVLRLCREYNVARLRFDRMQAEQMVGNLTRSGVRVQEYLFTASGAAKVARSLHIALRDRSVELPDDDEVRSEVQTVRMIETGPSTVKLSNPPGTHDDVLTAIGMLVADLTERPDIGFAQVSDPNIVAREMGVELRGRSRIGPDSILAPYALGATRGVLADLMRAQREQTPAMRAAGLPFLVPGSANDAGRVRRSY